MQSPSLVVTDFSPLADYVSVSMDGIQVLLLKYCT